MILFRSLAQGAWTRLVVALVAALVSGAASTGLIAMVASILGQAGRPSEVLWAGFGGLLVMKLVTNVISETLLSSFAQRALAELCRRLTQRVLETPLRRLEEVGIPGILATLTDDVEELGHAIQHVPNVAIQGAILLGCSLYLAWLSPTVFVLMLGIIVIGALGHRVLVSRAYGALQDARDARGTLLEHFRDLTEGAKELKLHGPRRESFLTQRIQRATETLRRLNLAALHRLLVAASWSQLLFYGLIAGLLFGLPALHGAGPEVLTGYVLGTLYMMNPVWGLTGGWPIFARGRIALARLERLGMSLGTPPASRDGDRAIETSGAWSRLDLEGVTFAYRGATGVASFVLGPLDLTLRRGEVVFLVGGNGSGKSTFAKVLTGLYPPDSGAIRLDGKAVSDANLEWYHQHFSVVFSDFYLFDSLLGLTGPDLDARARDYVAQLALDGKVEIRNGELSTTALSHGQRKRLALLTLLLEDRPIVVFDEWAADQDPVYRDIFYTKLIPELRARGKTVVVISHDERYYHLADRIIKLDYGRQAP